MDVKEFLERALHLDGAIDAQVAELTHLRELSLKIGTSKLEERVTHSVTREAPFAKWVERIVDKEREINAEIDKLVDVKLEISDFIDGIDNPQWQSLLRHRYVLCKSWPDVAVNMGCSLRTVHRLHKKILKNLGE
ncbi:DUF1492 domain-containing protein [Selenomonas sp. AB3002]|uniref:DUF1492 domain-containing protein n=1 Tax=Selenomonas sp. AB3002 TaxID=1392502 RepID=UPI000497ADF4